MDKGEQIVDTYLNVRFAHISVRTVRDNADRNAESAKAGPEVLLV